MILWFKSSGTAAHIYQVDACLETSGALKVATQLHILVPEKKRNTDCHGVRIRSADTLFA